MSSDTIALIGLMVALFGAIFAAFKYFSAEDAALRQQFQDAMKVAAAEESRARHNMANTLQTALAKAQLDQERLSEKLTALALDVVRRSELLSMETRLTAAIATTETRAAAQTDKIDQTRREQFAHMEAKIDRLVESIRGKNSP